MAGKSFYTRWLAVLIVPFCLFSAELPQLPQREAAKISSSHPRLLLNSQKKARLLANSQTGRGKLLFNKIRTEAEALLSVPPAQRELDGRRMLRISRLVLYRINTLAVAWMVTGNTAFSDRARSELLAVADFEDWHPSHFLDTAEMTLAVAIGYDWFHPTLSQDERKKLVRAIVEKGLNPSLPPRRHGWVSGTNNWNQVCHAGMVAGALAIYQEEPQLASRLIRRAIDNLPRCMKKSYAPNGAYPEGPMYWNYGTEFNIILLELLQNAFGHDFQLSEQPGFSRTGDYMRAMQFPSGSYYNYADCHLNSFFGLSYPWLIARFARPDYFTPAQEQAFLRACSPGHTNRRWQKSGGSRLLPLALLWLDHLPDKPYLPADGNSVYYSGDGAAIPLAVFRTGFEKDATCIGIKGGTARDSHGHMDIGSFILEMNGLKVAEELGMENYGKLESRGIQLWNNRQSGERWNLLRLGPESHNILRINKAPQIVDATGSFVSVNANSALIELSAIYAPVNVQRLVELQNGSEVWITDTLRGLSPGSQVRWQMCTALKINRLDQKLRLFAGDKAVILTEKSARGNWSWIDCDKLRHSYETPNPGKSMLYCDFIVPESGFLKIEMVFKKEAVNSAKLPQ